MWGRKKVPEVVERGYVGPSFSVGDPALAQFLGLGGYNDAGVSVTEGTALGLTAVYRSVALIAGTIAGLPLKTYRTTGDGDRDEIKSFLDNPGGTWLTPFEWTELVLIHLLLDGNAFLLHVYNGAGSLVALIPIHPACVEVTRDDQMNRQFKVQMDDGPVYYTEADMTQIMGPSLNGTRGLSPVAFARNALGTGIAGDKAAARMFGSGMLVGGLVTSDETLTRADAEEVMAGLRNKLTGSANAGDIALVNAALKFQPWTMNSVDAQFLESRQYSVTEVARIFGVPVELLAQAGATSWGSGIQELLRGFQRFTLVSWTSRVEERLSTLLPAPQHVEYQYKGLLQGTPAEEVALLIQQVGAGLLTVDEARAVMNLAPLPQAPVASAPDLLASEQEDL